MRNESDVIDVQAKGDEQAESLKTIGWISYLLHLIVAVAAVVPGAQVGIGILLVALIIDLVKKGDAAGTWQASHFSWRIRSVLWAGVLYVVTIPLWLLLLLPAMRPACRMRCTRSSASGLALYSRRSRLLIMTS